jgi:flavin-binding protein dodecin
VVQIRGHIEDGAVRHYQVVLKIDFKMEDSGE